MSDLSPLPKASLNIYKLQYKCIWKKKYSSDILFLLHSLCNEKLKCFLGEIACIRLELWHLNPPFRFLRDMKSGFLMSCGKVQRNISSPAALSSCSENRELLSAERDAVLRLWKKPGGQMWTLPKTKLVINIIKLFMICGGLSWDQVLHSVGARCSAFYHMICSP